MDFESLEDVGAVAARRRESFHEDGVRSLAPTRSPRHRLPTLLERAVRTASRTQVRLMMEEACDAVAKQVGDRFDEMEQERGLAPTGVNLNGPACTRVPRSPRPRFKLGHDLRETVSREQHLTQTPTPLELKHNLNFPRRPRPPRRT